LSRRIAIIAAHPDDEVLFAGATIARHAGEGDQISTLFLADGETARLDAYDPGALAEERQARREAEMEAGRILGTQAPVFLDLPDNRLDTVPLLDITKAVEGFLDTVAPQIIYTHHHGDLNADHNIAHRAVLTACRPLPRRAVAEIYAGETLSSTEWAGHGSGDSFEPNCFVDITDYLTAKLDALAAYEQELRPFPHPRSCESVRALAKFRGSTSGLEAAEAFQIIRVIK